MLGIEGRETSGLRRPDTGELPGIGIPLLLLLSYDEAELEDDAWSSGSGGASCDIEASLVLPCRWEPPNPSNPELVLALAAGKRITAVASVAGYSGLPWAANAAAALPAPGVAGVAGGGGNTS